MCTFWTLRGNWSTWRREPTQNMQNLHRRPPIAGSNPMAFLLEIVATIALPCCATQRIKTGTINASSNQLWHCISIDNSERETHHYLTDRHKHLMAAWMQNKRFPCWRAVPWTKFEATILVLQALLESDFFPPDFFLTAKTATMWFALIWVSAFSGTSQQGALSTTTFKHNRFYHENSTWTKINILSEII